MALDLHAAMVTLRHGIRDLDRGKVEANRASCGARGKLGLIEAGCAANPRIARQPGRASEGDSVRLGVGDGLKRGGFGRRGGGWSAAVLVRGEVAGEAAMEDESGGAKRMKVPNGIKMENQERGVTSNA
ncbi:unnamed protein product [Sphenostylis stenocarpa]|uniref:Uncharacterized protein n=1 Tax=Sphenostylis stenocarpa TaxID=92480 RepID=A0AA86TFW2_9FABA|nr:unnamed protein product [Sphenostylis stenocarpa]